MGHRQKQQLAFSKDLTPNEIRRYSRHLILPEVGREGQRKLKNAKVLLVGAGGLGCPSSLYLAAAGVGHLGIVDFDVVDESNLQRQVLFGETSVGKLKVEAAKSRLLDLNRHIEVTPFNIHLDSQNAMKVMADYDIIVDGSDNFPTRYLVNDACVLLGKPNVFASILRFEAQISVFNPPKGPCFRCLYSEPPPPDVAPSCAEVGVLGVLPGIAGALQANEAIKIILGIGDSLEGRLILFDSLSMQFQTLKVSKNPECAVCGSRPSITRLIDYERFCARPSQESGQEGESEISPSQLKKKMDSNEGPLCIIDIREPHEREISNIEGSTLVTVDEVSRHIKDFSKYDQVVLICRVGLKSLRAVYLLRKKGLRNVVSLKGGINAWSREVDPKVPQY